MRYPLAGPVVTLVLVLAGCGTGSGHERAISRADLGGRWPLTVSSGTLRCEGTGGTGEVTFATGGVTYAVNGKARATGHYQNLSAIWADDPSGGGVKADASTFINAGLQLCE
jgi:Protein of unknown function (DUF2511)